MIRILIFLLLGLCLSAPASAGKNPAKCHSHGTHWHCH